jgi:hypothetical protein
MQKLASQATITTSQRSGKIPVESLREQIVGLDTLVPLLDGTERRYVFLDNAASTPSFAAVLQCIEEFLPWYSGVHRGTGFKSLLATEVFDSAHDIVGKFVGADLDTTGHLHKEYDGVCKQVVEPFQLQTRRRCSHDSYGASLQ